MIRNTFSILFIILLATNMKSQNATATIGTLNECPPAYVTVPIDVTGFSDVAAMTIYIGYDTNALLFDTITNLDSNIPGVYYGAANGQLGITYSSLIGFNIGQGKLLDLNFYYNSNSSDLNFLAGTEIANSNLEVIPLETENGAVNHEINIIGQPDSVQVYPDSNVNFLINANGNSTYQWQENSGSGWNNLNNTFPYSGVFTHLLTITDVSLDFSGNLYRCVLSTSTCTLNSEAALLTVQEAYTSLTLGSITACPHEEVEISLNVFDFFDVREFTFNIGFDEDILTYIQLENVHSDLNSGPLDISPLGSGGISVNWSSNQSAHIANDKLFDIRFNYNDEDVNLTFEEGTQAINSLSNFLDMDFYNGLVNAEDHPLISNQPVDFSVMEGDEAYFSVNATETSAYKWQESTNNGVSWTELSNGSVYQNVSTAELTINNTPYSFDENQYACWLSNGICQIFSDAATLNVDTLTGISTLETLESSRFIVRPNPFNEFISFDFTIPVSADVMITITDMTGKEIYSKKLSGCQAGNNQHMINTGNFNSGMYVGVVRAGNNKTFIPQYQKIIKL